jgi:hypothetical protein
MQDGGEDGGDSYQQQDEFDGGDMDEGMGEQQQEDAPLSSENGAILDEEEGRRVYLMHMGTEVEEQIAGEFYEAPGDSFVNMEEVPPEDDEDMGGPTEQHHHKFKIGKRSANDDTLSDLEVFLQQEEGGVGNGGSVTVQWNNKLHEGVSVTCEAGFGLHHMRSVFSSGAQDRLFLFSCKRVAPLCMPGNNYNPAKRVCRWYKMNNIATNGQYHCPANYYLAGVQSKATCKHDREWYGMCCNTPHLCTSCSWTGYLNDFKGGISYTAPGVFGGMISIYNPTDGDRRYRVTTCKVRAC